MKTVLRFRWLQWVLPACLSVIAAGCGGGSAHGTGQKGGSYDACGKNPQKCANMGGTKVAIDASNRAGRTVAVLDHAKEKEDELLSNAGGVRGAALEASPALSSAATAGNAASLAQSREGSNSNSLNPLLRPSDGSGTGLGAANLRNTLGSANLGSSASSGNGAKDPLGGAGGKNGGAEGQGSAGAGAGAAGSRSGEGSAAAMAAAGSGSAARSSGSGGSGSGAGGSGSGMMDLYGHSGSDSADGSRSSAFGVQPGDINPVGSEDPSDYFTRLGMGEDIFRIVERRYRNKAVTWVKTEIESVGSKSRTP